MKTLYFIVKELKNENKWFSYSFTDNGAYITEGTFETEKEARFFISETCKPIYYKNFNSSYKLVETTENSTEMLELSKNLEEVLDFLNTEIEKPSFKFHMFIHNILESCKKF